MRTVRLANGKTVVAPDGSQIRELVAVAGGSMVHCALPKDAVWMAAVHATVDEVWYCLAGKGQVWRRREDAESVGDVGCSASTSPRARSTSARASATCRNRTRTSPA